MRGTWAHGDAAAHVRDGAAAERIGGRKKNSDGALRSISFWMAVCFMRLVEMIFAATFSPVALSLAVTTLPVPPHLAARTREWWAASLKIQMVRPDGHRGERLFICFFSTNCSFCSRIRWFTIFDAISVQP